VLILGGVATPRPRLSKEKMKISVLIPTLNPNKEYLRKALSSIPSNVDEVVLAGHGFDVEQCKDYLHQNVEVKVFKTTEGLTDTINQAVKEHITGNYFSILPDDDFYLPGMETIIDIVKASYADVFYFPSKNFINNEPCAGIFDDNPKVTYEKNFIKNQITGSAFIRKHAFIFLEGYKGDICQDWDLWNRALKSNLLFEYIDIPGIAFRFNDHSRLQKKSREIGFNKIQKDIQESANAWNKKLINRCLGWMPSC